MKMGIWCLDIRTYIAKKGAIHFKKLYKYPSRANIVEVIIITSCLNPRIVNGE
jgi:hypothetical protein